jgi:uncharacterized protein YcfJ
MQRAKPIVGLAIVLLSAVLMAGCANNPKPVVDPIFKTVSDSRYQCHDQPDNRNPVAKGATSGAGQVAIGGALGDLIGNPFGAGTGNDIAAGTWNARHRQNNRLQQCLRQSRG